MTTVTYCHNICFRTNNEQTQINLDTTTKPTPLSSFFLDTFLKSYMLFLQRFRGFLHLPTCVPLIALMNLRQTPTDPAKAEQRSKNGTSSFRAIRKKKRSWKNPETSTSIFWLQFDNWTSLKNLWHLSSAGRPFCTCILCNQSNEWKHTQHMYNIYIIYIHTYYKHRIQCDFFLNISS